VVGEVSERQEGSRGEGQDAEGEALKREVMRAVEQEADGLCDITIRLAAGLVLTLSTICEGLRRGIISPESAECIWEGAKKELSRLLAERAEALIERGHGVLRGCIERYPPRSGSSQPVQDGQ